MHFDTKNYLKSNRYHAAKYSFNKQECDWLRTLFFCDFLSHIPGDS